MGHDLPAGAWSGSPRRSKATSSAPRHSLRPARITALVRAPPARLEPVQAALLLVPALALGLQLAAQPLDRRQRDAVGVDRGDVAAVSADPEGAVEVLRHGADVRNRGLGLVVPAADRQRGHPLEHRRGTDTLEAGFQDLVRGDGPRAPIGEEGAGPRVDEPSLVVERAVVLEEEPSVGADVELVRSGRVQEAVPSGVAPHKGAVVHGPCRGDRRRGCSRPGLRSRCRRAPWRRSRWRSCWCRRRRSRRCRWPDCSGRRQPLRAVRSPGWRSRRPRWRRLVAGFVRPGHGGLGLGGLVAEAACDGRVDAGGDVALAAADGGRIPSGPFSRPAAHRGQRPGRRRCRRCPRPGCRRRRRSCRGGR